MIAFASMLVQPAKMANIKVPDDVENFDAEQYPHWMIFCRLQLGRSIRYPTMHWDNAKVISGIPDDKIKTLSLEDLIILGFQFS